MNFINQNHYEEGLLIEIEPYLLHNDYLLIDEKEIKGNNLNSRLKQIGIGLSDLQNLTGISKQNLNKIIKSECSPSIESAQKISFVLDCAINELFPLSQEDWYHPVTDQDGKPLYYNSIDNKIYNTSGKKGALKKGKYDYFDLKSNKYISLTEYNSIKSNLQKETYQKRYDLLDRNPKYHHIPRQQLKTEVKKILEAEIKEKYKKVYHKIVKKFIPYVITP